MSEQPARRGLALPWAASLLAAALLATGCSTRNPHFDASRPHHTPEGFRNNHAQIDAAEGSGFLRWQWERLRADLPADTPQRVPVVRPDLAALRANSARADGDVTVTWISHSTRAVAGGRAQHPDRPAFQRPGFAGAVRRPEAADGLAAAAGRPAPHRPGADQPQPLRPPRPRHRAGVERAARRAAAVRGAAGHGAVAAGRGHQPQPAAGLVAAAHRGRARRPGAGQPGAGTALVQPQPVRPQCVAVGRLRGAGAGGGPAGQPVLHRRTPATHPISPRSAGASAASTWR